MSCSLTSSSIPMDAVPSPKWAGAGLQRHSLHPMQESLPCIHQTDPWVVFLPFSYLKTKQNSPLSWHVKCHFVCHQTISLQSHNDPCAKKRGKGCTPPNPDPESQPLEKPRSCRINSHAEEQREVERPGPGRGQGRRKHKV